MISEAATSLKSDFPVQANGDALSLPTRALLGVSDDAEKALHTLSVRSIFDLALSRVFGAAQRLTGAPHGQSDWMRLGRLPADVVDSKAIAGKPLDALQHEPIESLDGIGPKNAALLKSAMGIVTIRDLANWPPYQSARRILHATLNDGAASPVDPEAPAELVPRFAQHPTDRVTYNAYVLTEIGGAAATDDLAQAGALSHDDAKGTLTHPAFGAALRFSHSWYPIGLSLGQLAYSLPLAPGESTKIAIVDFRRRTSSSLVEDISESESLSTSMTQRRAISEVVNAVASEVQSGRSEVETASDSATVGGAAGALLPIPALVGGAAGAASSRTTTKGVFSSSGRREIASFMQQNISASTHQHSFSARNRHAAVVAEAVAEEREQISTRTVTNYNHMHALTIQYFEVVQLYRTELRLEGCQRVLFVPMRVFDFTDERIILRYRGALIQAALDPYVANLLRMCTGVTDVTLALPRALPFVADPDDEPKDQLKAAKEHARRAARASLTIRMKFSIAQRQGGVIQFDGGGNSWQMPPDAELIDVGWQGRVRSLQIEAETGSAVTVAENGDGRSGNTVNGDLPSAIPLSRIQRIRVDFDEASAPAEARISLRFRTTAGATFSVPCDCVLPGGATSAILLRFSSSFGAAELGQLLNQQAVYYSQQIWLNADAHALAMMLSKYHLNNKRVLEYIDPQPVTVAGNAIGFLWHDEDDPKWKKWKAENATAPPHLDLVPIPTGGVFAEAVLGRFNSAEKLDVTRFWNWQDSPIPVQAPDIAAIQAGQREGAPGVAAGQLSPPVLNIVNPPELPAPAGMGAALSALTASNMFRDMSGAAQIAALAQASMRTSMEGAVAGSAQAGANMATFAEYQVEMAKLALSLIASLATGVPIPPAPGQSNITNAGAALNQAGKLDAETGGAPMGGSPPAQPGTGPSSGGSGGASGGGGGGGASSGQPTPGVLHASTRPRSDLALGSMLGGGGPTALAANFDLLRAAPADASSDPLAHLSPQEAADWYRRLATAVEAEIPGSLAAQFLKHWLDGGGTKFTFDHQRVSGEAFVLEGLQTARRVFLTEERIPVRDAFFGRWGGIVPRLSGRLGHPQWNAGPVSMYYDGVMVSLPMSVHTSALRALVQEDLTGVNLNHIDLFMSLHTFGLRTDVVVTPTAAQGSRFNIAFDSWKTCAYDRYDWDKLKGLKVPNPDFQNRFAVAKPVSPSSKYVSVFHRNAIRVESAGLAATFDLESTKWSPSDPSVVGPAVVDANKGL